jgi:hypothetical protein
VPAAESVKNIVGWRLLAVSRRAFLHKRLCFPNTPSRGDPWVALEGRRLARQQTLPMEHVSPQDEGAELTVCGRTTSGRERVWLRNCSPDWVTLLSSISGPGGAAYWHQLVRIVN